jgi:hypothetical protein
VAGRLPSLNSWSPAPARVEAVPVGDPPIATVSVSLLLHGNALHGDGYPAGSWDRRRRAGREAERAAARNLMQQRDQGRWSLWVWLSDPRSLVLKA